MARQYIKTGLMGFLMLAAALQNAYAEASDAAQSREFMDMIWNAHIFVYALYCGFVSILVKIVDYVLENQSNNNKQILPHQEIIRQAIPLSGWFASAGIVGYLAVIAGFFTTSPQSAVMVGLGWPMVYSRLKLMMEETYAQKREVVESATVAKIVPKSSGKT